MTGENRSACVRYPKNFTGLASLRGSAEHESTRRGSELRDFRKFKDVRSVTKEDRHMRRNGRGFRKNQDHIMPNGAGEQREYIWSRRDYRAALKLKTTKWSATREGQIENKSRQR